MPARTLMRSIPWGPTSPRLCATNRRRRYMLRQRLPEGLRRPRHRRRGQPDRVLLGLKLATVLAAGGLIGVLIVLANGMHEAAAPPLTIAPVPSSSAPTDDAGPSTLTRPTSGDLAPVSAESSLPALRPAPPNEPRRTKPTTTTRQASWPDLATVGERCHTPGTYAVTGSVQLVVCRSEPPPDPPRWQPIF